MFSSKNNVNSDVIEEYIEQVEQATNNDKAGEESIHSEHSDVKIIENHTESENAESNEINTDERHRTTSSVSKTVLTSIGWLKAVGRTRLNLISEDRVAFVLEKTIKRSMGRSRTLFGCWGLFGDDETHQLRI